MMLTRIAKDFDVLLANPVWLVVTPLTVQQALERNLIDSYYLDDPLSPTRASKFELVAITLKPKGNILCI